MNDRIQLELSFLNRKSVRDIPLEKRIKVAKSYLKNIYSDKIYDDIAPPKKEKTDIESIEVLNDIFFKTKILLKRIELSETTNLIELDQKEKAIRKEIQNKTLQEKLNFVKEYLIKAPQGMNKEKIKTRRASKNNNLLHSAIFNQESDGIIQEFIDKYPHFLYQKNNSGYTPIDLAKLLNRTKIVEYMMNIK